MEGKTEQARADLARLAIIKKQREEAAKKREEVRKGEKTTIDPPNTSVKFKLCILEVEIMSYNFIVVFSSVKKKMHTTVSNVFTSDCF